MNVRKLAAASFALLLGFGTAAQAVTFAFDYSGDGAGEGFNDTTVDGSTTFGAERRSAFQAAANIWGSYLASSYATETITIQATFDPLGGSPTSATLGQAGATHLYKDFGSNNPKYQASTFYQSALADHLYGSQGSSTPQIAAFFNSTIDTGTIVGNQTFYYGLDGLQPANKINFETVALHEICHGLGFSSLIQSDGSFFNSSPDAFDRHLYKKSAGVFLTTESNATRASDITSGDLYFRNILASDLSDAAALASNGSMTGIKLNAPATFAGGSSVSHIDQSIIDLMNASKQTTTITPSSLDLAVLSDIGWTIVPEPICLPMICAALLLTQRRRRVAA